MKLLNLKDYLGFLSYLGTCAKDQESLVQLLATYHLIHRKPYSKQGGHSQLLSPLPFHMQMITNSFQ